jgi:hypothetical protein
MLMLAIYVFPGSEAHPRNSHEERHTHLDKKGETYTDIYYPSCRRRKRICFSQNEGSQKSWSAMAPDGIQDEARCCPYRPISRIQASLNFFVTKILRYEARGSVLREISQKTASLTCGSSSQFELQAWAGMLQVGAAVDVHILCSSCQNWRSCGFGNHCWLEARRGYGVEITTGSVAVGAGGEISLLEVSAIPRSAA